MAVPTRSCLACRRRAEQPSLLRLTARDGTVIPDPSTDLPGRGAYLCHRESCLDAALAAGAKRLLRALRLEGDEATVDEQAIRAIRRRREPLPAEGGAHEQAGVSE